MTSTFRKYVTHQQRNIGTPMGADIILQIDKSLTNDVKIFTEITTNKNAFSITSCKENHDKNIRPIRRFSNYRTFKFESLGTLQSNIPITITFLSVI